MGGGRGGEGRGADLDLRCSHMPKDTVLHGVARFVCLMKNLTYANTEGTDKLIRSCPPVCL